jgi:hypothetical protein
MELRDLVALVTTAIAAIAALVAFQQYRLAVRWKHAEFVANEMKEFDANPAVRNAKIMLDYDHVRIRLAPSTSESDTAMVVDYSILATALTHHSRIGRSFSPEEFQLRETFDTFFDYLDRFGGYVKAGLAQRSDFEIYLHYWLDLFRECSHNNSPEFWKHLEEYIHLYGYTGVETLLANRS